MEEFRPTHFSVWGLFQWDLWCSHSLDIYISPGISIENGSIYGYTYGTLLKIEFLGPGLSLLLHKRHHYVNWPYNFFLEMLGGKATICCGILSLFNISDTSAGFSGCSGDEVSSILLATTCVTPPTSPSKIKLYYSIRSYVSGLALSVTQPLRLKSSPSLFKREAPGREAGYQRGWSFRCTHSSMLTFKDSASCKNFFLTLFYSFIQILIGLELMPLLLHCWSLYWTPWLVKIQFSPFEVRTYCWIISIPLRILLGALCLLWNLNFLW